MLNDAPLQEAYAELRALLARPEVPERVYTACLGLSEVQTKLFCSVSDSYRTEDGTEMVQDAGALNLGMRLEPSNFLRELLAALRAFDWPKVLSAVHAVAPGSVPGGKNIPPDTPKPTIAVPP